MSKLIESDKMEIIDLVIYGYSRIKAGKLYGVSGQYVGKLITTYIKNNDLPIDELRKLTNRKGASKKRDFIKTLDGLSKSVKVARLKIWEDGYQTGYNQGRHHAKR